MLVKHVVTWGLTIGLGLSSLGSLADGGLDGKRLVCKATTGARVFSWQVQLDGSRPVALVDEKDVAAEYSPSHVRIPLPAEGYSLFIGRISGRLVVSTPDGATVALGVCSARTAI